MSIPPKRFTEVSGAPLPLAIPQAAGPGPLGLTYTETGRFYYVPDREMPTDEIAVDIGSANSWQIVLPEVGAGTASSAAQEGGRLVSLGNNSRAYLNTGVPMIGTAQRVDIALSSYSATASTATRVSVAFRRPAEELRAGVNLSTGQPFADFYNPATGVASAFYIQPRQSNFPATPPAAVRRLVVQVMQNYVTITADFADGSFGTAIFICASQVVLNEVAKDKTWQLAAHLETGSASSIQVARMLVGRSRYDVIQNARPVTTTTGAPYTRGNELFFNSSGGTTANGALDLPADFWGGSALVLFSINSKTRAITHHAAHCVQRDGRYWTDGVGQQLYDEKSGYWYLCVNSWGNNEVSPDAWDLKISIYRTDQDATQGHNIWTERAELDFDNANFIHYDPTLVQIAGTWYCSATRKIKSSNSNGQGYWPVTYKNTSPDPLAGTWVLAWEDKYPGADVEGNCFVWDGPTCYTVVAGRGGFGYRFYNTVTGAYIGTRSGNGLPVYNYNPGHYCLLEDRRDGVTRYIVMLMDGGRTVIVDANEITPGYRTPLQRFNAR